MILIEGWVCATKVHVQKTSQTLQSINVKQTYMKLSDNRKKKVNKRNKINKQRKHDYKYSVCISPMEETKNEFEIFISFCPHKYVAVQLCCESM